MNAYTINFDVITKINDEQFYPLCPYNPSHRTDSVLELMSKTDSLKDTQEKMQEYMDNGVKLGWLINLDKNK